MDTRGMACLVSWILLSIVCSAGAAFISAPQALGAVKLPRLSVHVRERRAASGLSGLRAAGGGLEFNDVGDLAILGALKKLRGGGVTGTRAVHSPG